MRLSSVQFYLGVLVLTTGLLAGCANRTVQISEPVAWGTAEKVVQANNLFFAGQPDQRGLRMARDAGIGLVVNARSPDEMNWDEESAVRELGMQYMNIPISRSGPGFDTATIERLHKLVAENPDQNILMHCSSANRTSAWYGLYLVEKEGYELEEALSIAGQTGLTREALASRMREYLNGQ